jgi:hypothetical protein
VAAVRAAPATILVENASRTAAGQNTFCPHRIQVASAIQSRLGAGAVKSGLTRSGAGVAAGFRLVEPVRRHLRRNAPCSPPASRGTRHSETLVPESLLESLLAVHRPAVVDRTCPRLRRHARRPHGPGWVIGAGVEPRVRRREQPTSPRRLHGGQESLELPSAALMWLPQLIGHDVPFTSTLSRCSSSSLSVRSSKTRDQGRPAHVRGATTRPDGRGCGSSDSCPCSSFRSHVGVAGTSKHAVYVALPSRSESNVDPFAPVPVRSQAGRRLIARSSPRGRIVMVGRHAHRHVRTDRVGLHH